MILWEPVLNPLRIPWGRKRPPLRRTDGREVRSMPLVERGRGNKFYLLL